MENKNFITLELMKDIQIFYNHTNMIRGIDTYDDPYPDPVLGNYSLGYCKLDEKIMGFQIQHGYTSPSIKVGCNHTRLDKDSFIPFSETNFLELEERFKQDFTKKFASLLTRWKDYQEFSSRRWEQENFYQKVIQTHNKWRRFSKEKKLKEIKEVFNLQKRLIGLKIKQENIENILLLS